MVSQLNSAEKNVFLALFENIVEHTPKVAEELSELRPFSNNGEFLSAVGAVIGGLAHSEKVVSIFCVPFIIRNTKVMMITDQVGILSGHPDLAGRLADANLLTPESTREQREAGLHLLTAEERRRLRSHNAEYRDKFGFTFVICARENKAAAILGGLSTRLDNTKDQEVDIGIEEVKKIAKLRAADILKTVCTSKL